MQRTEQEYFARRNALISLFYTYLMNTVLRTANNIPEASINIRLGLIGEVGEVIDWVKKGRFHNKAVELAKVANELGDVMFYAVWERLAAVNQYSTLAHRNQYLSENFADLFLANELNFAERFSPATDDTIVELIRFAHNGVQSGDSAIYFVQAACGYFGLTIDEVIAANAAKLAERHPNGWDGGRRYDAPGLAE